MKSAEEWIESWKNAAPVEATEEEMETVIMPRLIRAIQDDVLGAVEGLVAKAIQFEVLNNEEGLTTDETAIDRVAVLKEMGSQIRKLKSQVAKE